MLADYIVGLGVVAVNAIIGFRRHRYESLPVVKTDDVPKDQRISPSVTIAAATQNPVLKRRPLGISFSGGNISSTLVEVYFSQMQGHSEFSQHRRCHHLAVQMWRLSSLQLTIE
jgi:hypothetical protein